MVPHYSYLLPFQGSPQFPYYVGICPRGILMISANFRTNGVQFRDIIGTHGINTPIPLLF